MSVGHEIILSGLVKALNDQGILKILDAGSGRTSLSIILSLCKNADVDAIVYPGDNRKIDSIKDYIDDKKRYNLIECDICKEPITNSYDLIVSHLLLGEATKFGNSCELLFRNLLNIRSKYLILVDYLEDFSVDYSMIENYLEENEYRIIEKRIVENDNPQKFSDFLGKHNVGYLVKYPDSI